MRKIGNNLINRMLNGDLTELLNYVKSDPELLLEVRRNDDAFIYYRKGKALEIKGLKVNPDYKYVPDTKLALSEPKEYFRLIKISIDNWLKTRKTRAEFDTQHYVARHNREKNDKYLILDMEYAFEQNQIEKGNRYKSGIIDLLGIERYSKRITFFEVKKGLSATSGKSGIEAHIKDFNHFLFGSESKLFRANLFKDIHNIIEDKTRLGLLKDFTLDDVNFDLDPEFVFIFHPDEVSEVGSFKKLLSDRHKLIIVNEDDYKLK